MAKKDKKRQKELQKRLEQGQASKASARHQELAAAQAQLAEELGDPGRLAFHLGAFAQLALVSPALHRLRFPAGAFVEALLEIEAPEEGSAAEKAKALRVAMLPRFASDELLPDMLAVLEAAQATAQNQGQLLAIMAARALATSSAQNPGVADHPFWNLVFDLSISEAVLSGHFLIRFVLGGLQPELEQISAAFAKGLAGAELSRELDELGLDETDPSALAQRYQELLRDEDPYHVQFDSVLHLAGLHVGLAETVGRVLTRYGASARARTLIKDLYERAFRDDVSQALVDELKVWFGKHLRALQDPADLGSQFSEERVEHERKRALTAYLALTLLPPEDNGFLRAMHVQSLVRARTLAGELEAPFVEKLWSEPTDTFSLEEYERFLRERGDSNRAKRVRTYVDRMKSNREQVKQTLGEMAEQDPPAEDAPPS